ncbi:hypothetical protein MKEN_00611100 [Mycena kentingensis (nom. inval.)]|nr:hypothetical protein MKEN_00611100 [Mycena kentingensis (nom. inval.)]
MSKTFIARFSAPGDGQLPAQRVDAKQPTPAVPKPSLLRETLEKNHTNSMSSSTNLPGPPTDTATHLSGSTSVRPASPALSRPSSHQFSSQETEHTFVDVNIIREAVAAELSGSWIIEDNLPKGEKPLHERLAAQFDATYPDVDVQAWLSECPDYDKKKGWLKVDRDAKLEAALYEPIRGIFQHVLDRMPKPSVDSKQERQVRIVADDKVLHEPAADAPEGAPQLKSSPDLMVVGSGPCCSQSRFGPIPDKCHYSNGLTPVEIKLKALWNDRIKQQVSVYAREIFVQQPNRSFVRVPLMNPHSMRLVHFDRTGAHVSPEFDYHSEAGAIILVKLIWLLASYDESEVGYDASIYWKRMSDNTYRRVIKVTPECVWVEDDTSGSWVDNTKEFEYEIVGARYEKRPDSIFRRRSIRSRGTTCWLVRRLGDVGGEIWFVKDYWMAVSPGRMPESTFLRELKGIPGVAQVLMWQDNLASTSTFRGLLPTDKLVPHQAKNKENVVPLLGRSLMRIVSEKYGDTLEKAETALELLEAAQSIVSGLRQAFREKRVLHCDISFHNLLLSKRADGPAGVVIDYDMAMLCSEENAPADARTGTRAFQSIKLLLQNKYLGAHDTLDDLEAVFYVLCYVCYGFDKSGELISPAPPPIKSWIDTNLDVDQLGEYKQKCMSDILTNKSNYTLRRYPNPQRKDPSRLLHTDGPAILSPRLTAISRIIGELRMAREDAADDSDMEADLEPEDMDADEQDANRPQLQYSSSQAEADFEKFLAVINASIAQLKALPVPAPPSAPSTSTHTTPTKRKPQDPPNESPNTKRQRRLKNRRLPPGAYSNVSAPESAESSSDESSVSAPVASASTSAPTSAPARNMRPRKSAPKGHI